MSNSHMLGESFPGHTHSFLSHPDGVGNGDPVPERPKSPEEIIEALKGLGPLYNQTRGLENTRFYENTHSVWRQAARSAAETLLRTVLQADADSVTLQFAALMITDIDGDQKAVGLIRLEIEHKLLERLRAMRNSPKDKQP